MNTPSKHRLDMLHGPIWNKLPRFAFPVAATAILEQLFNASDLAVVGNFTGAGKTVAVAAVGANSSLIALIINLFVGIALGANVVIANALGRRDREAVEKAVHTSVLFAVLGGALVALVGELAAEPLLRMLHVPDEVFPSALLTTLGVCGIRITWIKLVFPHSRTFRTIMTAYPVSLSATALLIFVSLLCFRPSRRYAHMQRREGES